jgi:selenocysteine lyase/cysteine desulfurase
MDAQTLMILISSKTRFGDAPCSRSKGNKPNTYYLQRLIAALRERHPVTFVVLDGAQSIGRALPEHQLLGADVFLGSGAKALGTGEAGFIALRNELAASVGYQPSMLPLDHIVAMGMALNNHDSCQRDLRRMEGNCGEQGQHEGWYNIARRMRHLTTCALQEAQSHGANVLRLLQANGAQGIDERLRGAGELLGGEKGLQRLFGCEVLSPYHCNPLDHVGILTLLFPNMKGEQMAGELARRFYGMQVLPCRHRNRALRISFDYGHSAKDVSELFTAMATTQSHIAARDVLEGKPWREVYDLHAPPSQA